MSPSFYRLLGRGVAAISIAFAAACGADSTAPKPTALAAVGTQTLAGPAGGVLATPLTVRVTDGSANPVAGVVVTFTVTAGNGSVSPTTATTGATGQASTTLTLGGSAGPNEVTATVAGIAAPIKFTATGVATASSCAAGPTPPTLTVGQVLTGASVTSLCLRGSAGAEYAVVAFNTSTVGSATASFELLGSGIGAPPVASRAPLESRAVSSLISDLSQPKPLVRNDAFEIALHERERKELTPLVPAAQAYYRSRATSGAARRNLIPTSGQVGDLVPLNIDGQSGCSGTPKTRSARIAAIGAKVVILADTSNPIGGFTDADYASIAAQVDTFVVPLDSAAFGAVTDIDNNGKIIVIYTRTINELSSPNSEEFVGGLAAFRDLFPTVATAGFQACTSSNYGEMFYMMVPDTGGVVNNNKRSKAFVLQITVGTIAHELQHITNAGRRLYILQQGGSSWVEQVYLNEGLAHIAEELAYYRASKNTPRLNLGPSTIRSSQAQVDAYNSYFSGNFGRYRSYLNAVSTTSPYGTGDALATRGAIWNFLRYAADRLGQTDGDLWFRLVNGATTGLPNLQTAFGVDQAGLTALFRDWATSVYADELATGLESRYTQPSWAWRPMYQGLFAQPQTFPFVPISLTDAVPTATLSVAGGTFAAARFTIPGGVDAFIKAQGPSGTTLTAPVTLTLVRVR